MGAGAAEGIEGGVKGARKNLPASPLVTGWGYGEGVRGGVKGPETGLAGRRPSQATKTSGADTLKKRI